MRPTLSVIVPVYNAAPYLNECVESILSQLWPGCRLILVDDGSYDGSENICANYARQFPDYIVLKRIENSGLSSARNTALELVDTDYLAFCDADDRYLAGALPALVDVLENEADCDIVHAQFCQSSENRHVQQLDYTVVSAKEALINTLYQDKDYHNSACAKVYRSRVFEHIRFVDGRYYEDLEIHPRLYLSSTCIAVSKDVVYYYRPNPTSFINTWSDKRLDAIFATKSVLDYLSIHCPECVPAAQSRYFSASFNIFNLAVKHNLAAPADDCWKLIKSLRHQMLHDPNVRKKNKIAALMSYLGMTICSIIARIDKKR